MGVRNHTMFLKALKYNSQRLKRCPASILCKGNAHMAKHARTRMTLKYHRTNKKCWNLLTKLGTISHTSGINS